MRKFGMLLGLAVILCLSLSSCGTHKTEKEINDSNRYALVSATEAPQLQLEYEKAGARIGVYYLGRVSNVPLSAGDAVAHEKGKTSNAVYREDDFGQADLLTLKGYAISRVISGNVAESMTYTDANGNTGTVLVSSNPTVDQEHNIAEVLTCNKAFTPLYAFADSYDSVRTFIEEKKVSTTALISKKGIFHEACRTRVALFADCDFYAFAVYNSETNTVSVTYDLAVVDGSLGFGTDTSAESAFGASDANKGTLAFDPAVLAGAGIFDGIPQYTVTYETNGGSFITAPILTYTAASAALSTPTKQYFDFVGWYFDEALTEQATPETLRQRAANVTVYAKWSTQADVFTHESFIGLTSNIKGEETGRISIAGISDEKIAAYTNEGYKARVTYYYTVGVPLEHEETSDSSDMKVQLGFATDVAGTDFIEMAQQYHASVAPGSTASHTISFEAPLSYFVNYCAAVRLVVLSNDTSFAGICGRDAGTYSALKMVIEYIK